MARQAGGFGNPGTLCAIQPKAKSGHPWPLNAALSGAKLLPGDLSVSEAVRELHGGNLDIDLIPKPNLEWAQEACPWNEAEQTTAHRCAIKDPSICRHFRGVKPPELVLCAYP